jgi:ferredoxin
MGHLIGKDIYRKLGKKVDGLSMRAPNNKALYAILKELYSPEEAELIVKMPYSPATIDKIQKITGFDSAKLQNMLNDLADKGLIMDVKIGNRMLYIISPMVIGIFEFTMMRTRGELNMKEWAKLFDEYLHGDDSFYRANIGNGNRVAPLRTIPHEGSINDEDFVEIFDYEKATSIVEKQDKFAIGLCSCRHEKMHTGTKTCDIPLEKCSTFGSGVDYMTRHGFAKEVSKSEMLDNLAKSREMNLVFCADNVKSNVSFICHCCGCCCNVLLGISRQGFPSTIVTSNYLAQINADECVECGVCADVCPVEAIIMSGNGLPDISGNSCLGCGVCALNCSSGSLKLVPRKQKVIYPEDTFEKVLLQCLERGTLQNQMFPEPDKINHKFLRAFVGGFLRLPPIKKALLGDSLRSRFLDFIRSRA